MIINKALVFLLLFNLSYFIFVFRLLFVFRMCLLSYNHARHNPLFFFAYFKGNWAKLGTLEKWKLKKAKKQRHTVAWMFYATAWWTFTQKVESDISQHDSFISWYVSNYTKTHKRHAATCLYYATAWHTRWNSELKQCVVACLTYVAACSLKILKIKSTFSLFSHYS